MSRNWRRFSAFTPSSSLPAFLPHTSHLSCLVGEISVSYPHLLLPSLPLNLPLNVALGNHPCPRPTRNILSHPACQQVRFIKYFLNFQIYLFNWQNKSIFSLQSWWRWLVFAPEIYFIFCMLGIWQSCQAHKTWTNSANKIVANTQIVFQIKLVLAKIFSLMLFCLKVFSHELKLSYLKRYSKTTSPLQEINIFYMTDWL